MLQKEEKALKWAILGHFELKYLEKQNFFRYNDHVRMLGPPDTKKSGSLNKIVRADF